MITAAWTTWLWVGPLIGVAVVLALYALSGWIIFGLALLSALWDLGYGRIRYGRRYESDLTRWLFDHT